VVSLYKTREGEEEMRGGRTH